MQRHFQQPDSESLLLPTPTEIGETTSETREEAAESRTVEPTAAVLSSSMQQAAAESAKWLKRRRRVLGVSSRVAGFSLMGAIGSSFLMFYSMTWLSVGIICFLTLLISLFGLLAGVVMRPLGKNPLQSLWISEDVAAVGPLLDATQMLLPDMKAKALGALTRLLPRMQAEDAARLTANQRGALRQLLSVGPVESPDYTALAREGLPTPQIEAMRDTYQARTEHQIQLVLGALHVLTYIGAGQEVALVKRLAAGKGVAWHNAAITQAAQECLTVVQARAAQEHDSRSYLRAAGAPAAHGDTLLRPATETAETDNQSLLRASKED